MLLSSSLNSKQLLVWTLLSQVGLLQLNASWAVRDVYHTAAACAELYRKNDVRPPHTQPRRNAAVWTAVKQRIIYRLFRDVCHSFRTHPLISHRNSNGYCRERINKSWTWRRNVDRMATAIVPAYILCTRLCSCRSHRYKLPSSRLERYCLLAWNSLPPSLHNHIVVNNVLLDPNMFLFRRVLIVVSIVVLSMHCWSLGTGHTRNTMWTWTCNWWPGEIILAMIWFQYFLLSLTNLARHW